MRIGQTQGRIKFGILHIAVLVLANTCAIRGLMRTPLVTLNRGKSFVLPTAKNLDGMNQAARSRQGKGRALPWVRKVKKATVDGGGVCHLVLLMCLLTKGV